MLKRISKATYRVNMNHKMCIGAELFGTYRTLLLPGLLRNQSSATSCVGGLALLWIGKDLVSIFVCYERVGIHYRKLTLTVFGEETARPGNAEVRRSIASETAWGLGGRGSRSCGEMTVAGETGSVETGRSVGSLRGLRSKGIGEAVGVTIATLGVETLLMGASLKGLSSVLAAHKILDKSILKGCE